MSRKILRNFRSLETLVKICNLFPFQFSFNLPFTSYPSLSIPDFNPYLSLPTLPFILFPSNPSIHSFPFQPFHSFLSLPTLLFFPFPSFLSLPTLSFQPFHRTFPLPILTYQLLLSFPSKSSSFPPSLPSHTAPALLPTFPTQSHSSNPPSCVFEYIVISNIPAIQLSSNCNT